MKQYIFKLALSTIFFALFAASAEAQTEAQTTLELMNPGQKSIQMVRTDTPPIIDGVLDDVVWKNAAFIDDLHQTVPIEYAVASEKTEVYLLYDDNALYIGAKLYMPPDQISRNVLRRNASMTNDDYFFVTLDPFNNKRSGVFFGINPNGVRLDGLYRNISEYYGDWDTIFYVETSIVEDGWIVEYEIPFKSISFDPTTDTWGLNFSRKIQNRNEQMAWVSNDRRFDPSSAGLAVGFENLNQGVGLDIIPSVSVKQDRTYSPGSTESEFDPSLDVVYKITPALNGSLTFNTDFSATEVDDRQVNLTRFGLFFPEKRDFFLREADIFDFGRINQNGRPFFSRKIGLGRNSQTVDLEAGAKISGRIGDWELGALSIRQDASTGLNADTLNIMRIKTGIGAESTIGAIYTEGDPRSNISNSLVGLDYLYRNSQLPGGRILEISSWYQQSSTDGISGDDQAAGISAEFISTNGLAGKVSARRYEANFNPALGFANRVGVDDLFTELNYTLRPNTGPIQQAFFSISLERFNNIGANLQSESISITPFNLTNRTGDSVFWRSNFDREVLTSPFQIYPGVIIPPGEYEFDNHGIEFRGAGFRKVSGRIAFVKGSFYDGNQNRVFGNVTWQPSPKIRTNLGFNITDVKLPQGDFTTRVLSAGFDYVFSSTLSLVNLVQYDNVSEIAGINIRLHWVPEEGQELFIVLNHSLADYDQNNRFDSIYTGAAAKFSYTFRY